MTGLVITASARGPAAGGPRSTLPLNTQRDAVQKIDTYTASKLKAILAHGGARNNFDYLANLPTSGSVNDIEPGTASPAINLVMRLGITLGPASPLVTALKFFLSYMSPVFYPAASSTLCYHCERPA